MYRQENPIIYRYVQTGKPDHIQVCTDRKTRSYTGMYRQENPIIYRYVQTGNADHIQVCTDRKTRSYTGTYRQETQITYRYVQTGKSDHIQVHTDRKPQVRIQDLVRGGPSNYFTSFADGAQRRRASEASIYWPGSRARLRALEALEFLSVKYAFSHFSWHLFFKIFNLSFRQVHDKICVFS